MPKIYGQANCVIVWLGEMIGETTHDGQPLELIHYVAEDESVIWSTNETNHEPIMSLLNRDWFQRIWVRKGFLTILM